MVAAVSQPQRQASTVDLEAAAAFSRRIRFYLWRELTHVTSPVLIRFYSALCALHHSAACF